MENPNTLVIMSDSFDNTRANFHGFLSYEILDENETQYKLKVNTNDLLNASFWVDKSDVTEKGSIDPSAVIKWLLKKLNKALNGQDQD